MTTAVVIGRFQPFHDAHLALVQMAYTEADRVLVVVGSIQESRELRNPWDYMERYRMISGECPYVAIAGVADKPTDVEWASNVMSFVRGPARLVGHNKDASSFYLKLFPDWDFLESGQLGSVGGEEVRRRFFAGEAGMGLPVPKSVAGYLAWWKEYERTGFDALARRMSGCSTTAA